MEKYWIPMENPLEQVAQVSLPIQGIDDLMGPSGPENSQRNFDVFGTQNRMLKFRIAKKKRLKNWMGTPLFWKIPFSFRIQGTTGIQHGFSYWMLLDDQFQIKMPFKSLSINQSPVLLEDQFQKKVLSETDMTFHAHWIYSGEIDHDAYRSKVKISKETNWMLCFWWFWSSWTIQFCGAPNFQPILTSILAANLNGDHFNLIWSTSI